MVAAGHEGSCCRYQGANRGDRTRRSRPPDPSSPSPPGAAGRGAGTSEAVHRRSSQRSSCGQLCCWRARSVPSRAGLRSKEPLGNRDDVARIDETVGLRVETTVATPDRHARLIGPGGVTAREGDGVDHRDAIAILVAARRADLAQDVERPIGRELYADLRADQEAIGLQAGLDLLLQLTRGQAIRRDLAHQRQCQIALAIERELARQIGVPEDDDLELIARGKAVAARTGAVLRYAIAARHLRGRARRQQADAKDGRAERLHAPGRCSAGCRDSSANISTPISMKTSGDHPTEVKGRPAREAAMSIAAIRKAMSPRSATVRSLNGGQAGNGRRSTFRPACRDRSDPRR